MKIQQILALIAIVALITFTGWLVAIVGREFAQFDEETRRLTQEESRAYQEGMAQNLDKLCLEWETTGNDAIARAIRHRVSAYKGELPAHVQQCVDRARKD